jgi:hypothetical protein
MNTLASLARDPIWAIGHSALDQNGVFWKGRLLFNSSRVVTIESRNDLAPHLDKLLAASTSIVIPVEANSFAIALPEHYSTALKKVVDLGVVIQATTHTWSRDRRSKTPIVSILGEFLRASTEGKWSITECRAILRGDLNDKEPRAIADALNRMLSLVIESAQSEGEEQRIIQFEIPASKALLKASQSRIRFDTAAAKIKLGEISDELQSFQDDCLLDHGIDLDQVRQSAEYRLALLNLEGKQDTAEDDLGLFPFLEVCSYSSSERLKDLAKHWKLKRRVQALRTIAFSLPNGLHPIFESIGTATGRILMREPNLQWLAKGDRKYLLPGEGRSLIYIDYKCFEPTILAIQAKDQALLRACKDDLYSDIAVQLGLPTDLKSRKFAKIFLLCLLYGRSQLRLTEDLAEFASLEYSEANGRHNKLRDWMSLSFEFQKKLSQSIAAGEKATTTEGNFRVLHKDRAYVALNHFLQGTASLIFKEALTNTLLRLPDAQLLAPMHDALLLSVPQSNEISSVMIVKDCMEVAAITVIGERITTTKADWGMEEAVEGEP